MRIHSLEIHNIRGIRHFVHNFQGKNAIILGHNGAGKSSILDAIDFLLTGDISRLQGEGTGELSLKRHDAHVDWLQQLENCYVRMSVELPGISEQVLIERALHAPEKARVVGADPQSLERLVCLARQGQHYLTRRKILHFVHVTPANRAKLVKSLLELDSVEKTRQCLKRIHNSLRAQRDTTLSNFENSRSGIMSLLNVQDFEHSRVLCETNAIRDILGASPITEVSTETIRMDLPETRSSDKSAVSHSLMLEQINAIVESTSVERLREVAYMDKELRDQLGIIRKDPELLRSIDKYRLIELGIELLHNDTCPLCDKNWQQSKLEVHLQSKLQKARSAEEVIVAIRKGETQLAEKIRVLLVRVERLVGITGIINGQKHYNLESWKANLRSLQIALQDSIAGKYDEVYATDQVASLFVDRNLRTIFLELVAKLKVMASEQSGNNRRQELALEKLTVLSHDWQKFQQHKQALQRAEETLYRAAKLESAFVKAQDEVLNGLYQSVSDEFGQLYSELHAQDESCFKSEMYSRGAGFHVDVDFYERGKYPPNAYHSEGHQDSMGLCMFLVLSERLAGEDLRFMLLDDVVSSVDVGHRRDLARILANKFTRRQIILTTHDPDWCKMLLNERFAKPPNQIRIDRWSIDLGIVHTDIKPEWDIIGNYLHESRVLEATTLIRNWAERFFKNVCHNLRAPVPYKIEGKYTLDELQGPGLKRVKDSIKDGIKVAKRTEKTRLLSHLESLDDRRCSADREIRKETWLLNRVVHDNEGIPPGPNEVRNALNALKAYSDLLHCDKCSQMVTRNSHARVLRCRCGKLLWAV